MKSTYFKKKGSSDLIYIFVTIVILSVLLPVFNLFMGSMGYALQDSTDNVKAKAQVQELTTGYRNSSDMIFVFVYFGLYLGAIVLSYFLDTHPLFILAGLVIFIVLTWVGMVYANSYYDMTNAGNAFSNEVASNFPMMSFIMTWFIELNAALTIIILIVLYRKNT